MRITKYLAKVLGIERFMVALHRPHVTQESVGILLKAGTPVKRGDIIIKKRVNETTTIIRRQT